MATVVAYGGERVKPGPERSGLNLGATEKMVNFYGPTSTMLPKLLLNTVSALFDKAVYRPTTRSQ